MRIIAGKLKGRTILTDKKCTYRPATGMLREAIFSILSSGQFLDAEGNSVLQDAVTIDLFGGTGSLSFEAISRGASTSIIVEKDRSHVKLLQENINKLSLSNQVKGVFGDATRLPPATVKCNIAFIDPPFNSGLVEATVKSLIEGGWLANDAKLVVRAHIKDEYDISSVCKEVLDKKYHKSTLRIFVLL
jgi:16S rRNA (guanine966-N2)-methyltransferase